ncbi:MAG: type IV pilin N-terminal domain-containing protein [Methanocorpusculum sp.]|uniref:type IV pilin N-terminal domain-containing protein n=1 Tax=Methanocorpusculum sp. TaxID=2058474 RepID=UPI00271DB91E|nr:type IV pilin N-terminal domain-containing protein [Methanocorpusculum sp.]MDO9522159.1 type IV pilin N-terminal domain-containing protein [Methanocorpusculum sp.]
MRTDNEKNDGVSPVVGVMLMLVVTIIVAALVAAFAGGLGSSAPPAPSAGFDFTIHAGGKTASYPGVVCEIPVATGEFTSNQLKIITTYVVPDTYNGVPLTNAGKTITHTITGQVEDYGIDLSSGSASVSWASAPVYSASDDPFVPKTQVYNAPIVATTGNGLTVGYDMNDYLYFGGNAPIASGTEWWFKEIDRFLGFPTTERTIYGFTEGSVVHITVIHVPSGTVLSDQDVTALW